MAYNVGLNPVTGRGGQTVDALKSKVLSFDDSITSITKILEGEYNHVVVETSTVSGTLMVDIPSSAHIFIIDFQCDAGEINTSCTVRFKTTSKYIDVTRVNNCISTSQSSHSFVFLYRVENGPIIGITKSGTPLFLASMTGSITSEKYTEFTQVGVVVDAPNSSIPAGSTMTVYYR